VPATAAITLPPVVVFSKLPEAILLMVRLVVEAVPETVIAVEEE